jgi:hypothetical protein
MARPTTSLLAFVAVAAAFLFPTSALAQLPTEPGSGPQAGTVVVVGEQVADKAAVQGVVAPAVGTELPATGVDGDGFAWGEVGIGVVGVFAMGLLLVALTLFATHRGSRRPAS